MHPAVLALVAAGLVGVTAPPAEGTTPPAPAEADANAVFGVCAQQGPLIGGDVLARLLVATPPASQVVGLTARSAGATIREVEIPYYGWQFVAGPDGVTAEVEGVPDPVDHFWFWIALDDVQAAEVTVEIEATLLDGTLVRHVQEPQSATDHPLVRIPVDPSMLAGPPAGARPPTPLTGREPCRIGDYPASTTERPVTRLPVSAGDDDLPAGILVGFGVALLGIGFLVGRTTGRR
jgi:hypothetical protein